MTNEHNHDATTSNVMLLSSQSAHMQHAPDDDAAAEVDEPPDDMAPSDSALSPFKRNTIRKRTDHSESLLTRAIQHSEGETTSSFSFTPSPTRRRSMNSNISVASTIELAPDTGLTSPARTSTPSPPASVFSFARLSNALFDAKPKQDAVATKPTEPSAPAPKPKDPAVEALAKKRCISFACGPKPEAKKLAPPQQHQPAAVPEQSTDEQKPQRRSCIKFACPAKPSAQNPPALKVDTTPTALRTRASPSKEKARSPSFPRKHRSPSTNQGRSRRSSTPKPTAQSSEASHTKKYLTANHWDLSSESSRFHEIASDEPQEEDWIRLNYAASGRLTINDTLRKENEIRRLGKEAEDEAFEEEEEKGELDADVEDEAPADEIDEDVDEDDEEEDDEEDEDVDGMEHVDNNLSGYGSDDDALDGYNTDSEVGFADSDEDEDGGDLQLWTPSQGLVRQISLDTPINRRPSMGGNRSDSSISDVSNSASRVGRERRRRIKIRPGTPELPDSTDFVCGTLDEDRPLEDAYISCMEQRRREKTHLIPQDIDPSFPTSDPEDDEEDLKSAHDSDDDDDDDIWIHGELEDLHHEKAHGAERRKKRSAHTSPKRYHSPPPKRHHSPAPKGRGRSPRRLPERQSPRRIASPPPRRTMKSPPKFLIRDENQRPRDFKTLTFQPGLTHTKSLPRAPAIFPNHLKGHRRGKPTTSAAQGHVRGAIDIVKGLEKKRQRRKEKFKEKHFQKHCNKARKGQIHEKKPQPGQGAERMREIGLLMAGKRGQGQFVLSI